MAHLVVRFEWRRRNEALGRYPLQGIELEPTLGFILADYPGMSFRFRSNLSHRIQSWANLSECKFPAYPALRCPGFDSLKLASFGISKAVLVDLNSLPASD